MQKENKKVIQLLSVRDVTEMTGLSVFTIYSWVSQKKIPFVKIGSRTLFDSKDILAWIEAHKVQPEGPGI